MDEMQKSILQMARGAIMERVDYAMPDIIKNIMDPNTKATEARKLTLELTFKPDDSRQNIPFGCVVKTKLAATNPITSVLYVADEDTIVEMVPQIPGQQAMAARSRRPRPC